MLDVPSLANVEAEAALLGALMHSAKFIDPTADILAPGDFFEPLHGRISVASSKVRRRSTTKRLRG